MIKSPFDYFGNAEERILLSIFTSVPIMVRRLPSYQILITQIIFLDFGSAEINTNNCF